MTSCAPIYETKHPITLKDSNLLIHRQRVVRDTKSASDGRVLELAYWSEFFQALVHNRRRIHKLIKACFSPEMKRRQSGKALAYNYGSELTAYI